MQNFRSTRRLITLPAIAPVTLLLSIQKNLGLRTFKHRQGAKHPRPSTSIGRNWNWPAGFRVKNVAVLPQGRLQRGTQFRIHDSA